MTKDEALESSSVLSFVGGKWYKQNLTYQIVNWPRHLSHGPVQLAVRTAFQLWSNVSGLVFHELSDGPTDIRLAFYEGEHNDGTSNAFDGPGTMHINVFLLLSLSKLNFCLEISQCNFKYYRIH